MSNGRDLRSKADKKANSTGSFFFSNSGRFEEARDLYLSAATSFILEKNWKDAGDCHCQAAEMSLKQDEVDDAANDFWNASKSYKKTNPERELFVVAVSHPRSPQVADTRVFTLSAVAIAALQRTIDLLKQKGRLRQAADREKEVANIFVQEGGDLASALAAFEQAGELYSAEDATA